MNPPFVIENLQANLGRQLASQHRSDEDLITLLEQTIAEKEAQRDEELRKEEERFAKETAKAQAQHEKRKAQVQKQLNEEMEIQKKHQADFDRLKDKAVEDDITRLKKGFEFEMDERRKQHEFRMDELKKQFEEIQAVMATGNAQIQARSEVPATTPVSFQTLPQRSGHMSMVPTGPVGPMSTVNGPVNVTMNNQIMSQIDMSSAISELGWSLNR